MMEIKGDRDMGVRAIQKTLDRQCDRGFSDLNFDG
jgi:hypothetical protein